MFRGLYRRFEVQSVAADATVSRLQAGVYAKLLVSINIACPSGDAPKT